MAKKTQPKQAATAHIRTRIVGHSEEDPADLMGNPLNFRRHPGNQLEALRGSMKELGWIKSVLVNRTTGHVIDGHARCEEAMRQGAKVPVDWVELSPEEERLALAVLDPITELATRDPQILSDLLAEVETQDAGLQALLDELAGKGKMVDEAGMPDLPSGDREPFQEKTFILHDEQAEQVDRAIEAAKKLGPFIDSPNENSNGNALARICETFLSSHVDR